VQQRICGKHHRGEVRRTQECTTHLFKYHAQLDVRESHAPELFGNVQTHEAHLRAHLFPHSFIEALLRFHLRTHRRLG